MIITLYFLGMQDKIQLYCFLQLLQINETFEMTLIADTTIV